MIITKSVSYLPMRHSFLFASFISVFLGLTAGDWNEYRGPGNDGLSNEKIASSWPANGPKVLWKAEASKGFSSFVVSGDRAFTLVLGNHEGVQQELCVAFEAATGKPAWTVPLGVAKYQGGGDAGKKDNDGGDGPRSTPVVENGRVYVYSADMVLSCLDASNGKSLWTRDIVKDFQGQNISWKNASSPVIDGGLVFVAGGGSGQSMIAFGKSDGKLAWKTGDEKMTHATPVPATIEGVRQIVFFTQSGLVAVGQSDGKPLWKFPFRFNVSTAASPVVAGNLVYCSAGYGVGAAVAKVTKSGGSFSAEEVWRLTGNKPVANHWSTPVYHDGHLYGMFSFKEYGEGPLKCVELATGKVKWERPGFGAGNVIAVSGKILALGDDGTLVLLEANSNEYKPLSQSKVLTGKCWSTPALSRGRLFLRSTKEAVCLDVSSSMSQLN